MKIFNELIKQNFYFLFVFEFFVRLNRNIFKLFVFVNVHDERIVVLIYNVKFHNTKKIRNNVF